MPRLAPHNVTIREVAAAAGVAFTTAAAALRGDAVAAATLGRVKAAADRLGYQRNLAASLLGSKARKRDAGSISIAYIVASMGHPLTHNPMTSLRSLEPAARTRGMIVHRHHVRDEKEASQLGRMLSRTGVDGILLRASDPHAFVRAFPVDAFCLLGQEQTLLPLGVDVVVGEHFLAVLGMLREIHARGFRRLGVVLRHHQPRLADDDLRRGACLTFQHETVGGCAIDIFERPFGPIDPAELDVWLRRFKPDAVVGFNIVDHLLISDLGHKLPFAGMVIDPPRQPGIAGVVYDQHWTVALALETLEEKVRMRQRGLRKAPRQILAHLPFIDAASLPLRAPAPARRC